jgi:hypothetical protein
VTNVGSLKKEHEMNDPEGVEHYSQGQRPWNDGEEKTIEADVSEFR